MGTLKARIHQGKRNTHNAIPNNADALTHTGTEGADHCAQGTVAACAKPIINACKPQAAMSHAWGTNKPNKQNGVTTKVTQGTANQFANKPTIT